MELGIVKMELNAEVFGGKDLGGEGVSGKRLGVVGRLRAALST